MTDTQHELTVRVAAAQDVVDRCLRTPFQWGKVDCGRSIVAPVLRAMGHHCPLAPFGAYTTEFGARRALKRNGFASMEDYLDQRPLFRIGHAGALPGDFIGLAGEGGWLSIALAVGNGRVFGFFDGMGQVVQPLQISAAWRVPCLR